MSSEKKHDVPELSPEERAEVARFGIHDDHAGDV